MYLPPTQLPWIFFVSTSIEYLSKCRHVDGYEVDRTERFRSRSLLSDSRSCQTNKLEMLFRRSASTVLGFVITCLLVGWGLIVSMIVVGRAAMQTKERGPYYSVSGNWRVSDAGEAMKTMI
ncbi:hypothetical protein BDP27DRAFT_762166 [Rhodocollybia butyracea]|uniref:Uncharacterized protein n=1 Tax=Rhodocollybia butyracea TaxID=206335 RepID=A0A9P5U8D4_9AGAR|nr:hypothetical protein BDP27DRAFT_762166 [Rhodocollybia butyracea]